MNKSEIGKFGEDFAARYLSGKGYMIKDRNFRGKHGEIDIIAYDMDGCLVFVEVKTRKNDDYGYPSEFVDRKQQKRLRYMAQLYSGDDMYMRFDIIEVYYGNSPDGMYVKAVNHIENAF